MSVSSEAMLYSHVLRGGEKSGREGMRITVDRRGWVELNSKVVAVC